MAACSTVRHPSFGVGAKTAQPESLEIVEVDDPTPGPHEIVIDARAALELLLERQAI